MPSWKLLLKEGDVLCFYDIVVKIKELPTPEGKIINKVISVCRLILVNPATNASGEHGEITCDQAFFFRRSAKV